MLALLAASKLAGSTSDPVYAREIVKEGVVPMLLHVLQDYPLVTQKVSLALLQVLHDLIPSVPNAEAILEAWSPNKVTPPSFCRDSFNSHFLSGRSRNCVRSLTRRLECNQSISLP